MTTVTHDKHWKEVWDALDEDGKEAYLKERDMQALKAHEIDPRYPLTTVQHTDPRGRYLSTEANLLMNHVTKLCSEFHAELVQRFALTPDLNWMIYEISMHALSLPEAITAGVLSRGDSAATRAVLEAYRLQVDPLVRKQAEEMAALGKGPAKEAE